MSRKSFMAAALFLAMAGPGLAQKPPAPSADPAPMPPPGPTLVLQNGTPNVVNNVYLSLASQQSWGQDQLGANEVVRAGGNRSFSLPPGDCIYDIRIVYQGGLAEERRRVDACNERDIVLPMAGQRVTAPR